MYESRSNAWMRLHAGQVEDVLEGTQCGCNVPKTPYILRMFKGTFSLDDRVINLTVSYEIEL